MKKSIALIFGLFATQANAGIIEHITNGDFETGEEYCLTYFQTAVHQQDHKAMVLAQLALAHHPTHQQSALNDALTIAQECGDQNLIAAVKRAFDLSEYSPTPHVF